MKRLAIAALIILTMVGPGAGVLRADMSSDLTNMLGNFQTMSNYSVPGSYQGQTSGYLTGGSLSVRVPVTSLNPVSFTPPSIHAGCSGIDLNMGGLSYLNANQIVQKLQSVIANSSGVLFMLALQTLCPECQNIQSYMEKASSFMNQLNMNSCQAAQKLVQLGTDYMASDTQQKCITQMVNTGAAATQEDAKLQCSGNNNAPTTAAAVGSELDPTSNFTYQATQNLSYGSDPELAREILSLVGTVIVKPSNNAAADGSVPYEQSTKEQKISVMQLMTGDTNATLYQCPNTSGSLPYNCATDMTVLTGQTIAPFTNVVGTVVTSIFNKLSTPYSGSASTLTTGEMAFIQNTPLPIFQTLNILSTMPYGANELPVVTQMLTGYFAKLYIENILKDVDVALDGLRDQHNGVQLDKAKAFYHARRVDIETQLSQLIDNSPEKLFYTTQYLKAFNDSVMQRMPKDLVSNLMYGKKIGG